MAYYNHRHRRGYTEPIISNLVSGRRDTFALVLCIKGSSPLKLFEYHLYFLRYGKKCDFSGIKCLAWTLKISPRWTLCLLMFCPYGRFVPTDIFVPTGVLSHGCYVCWMFCLHGHFVFCTLCPSGRLVPPDVLSLQTFCPSTLCLWTFCLGTKCIYKCEALKKRMVI